MIKYYLELIFFKMQQNRSAFERVLKYFLGFKLISKKTCSRDLKQLIKCGKPVRKCKNRYF